MDNFEKIKKIVLEMENDIYKVEVKHQSSAGVRVRRQLQQIRDLSKVLRQDVQDILKKDEENKNNLL